jgi:hypothetical protein
MKMITFYDILLTPRGLVNNAVRETKCNVISIPIDRIKLVHNIGNNIFVDFDEEWCIIIVCDSPEHAKDINFYIAWEISKCDHVEVSLKNIKVGNAVDKVIRDYASVCTDPNKRPC